MIELFFIYGSDIAWIIIRGNSVKFRQSSSGNYEADIEGLNISKEGVIKEHPDLKNNPLWKEEAIKRFKEHIKSLPTETAVADYLIEDLKKYGYILKRINQGGMRPKNFK